MLCAKCKKRMAVVFISKLEGGKQVNEGYCITCAKELGLAPVDDILGKMGISEDDLKNLEGMEDEMALMAEDGDFSMGGAQLFPFGGAVSEEGASETKENEKGDTKEKKSPKLKYLTGYCTNLTEKAKNGEMDRIVGRDREIYRSLQILCRRVKNNPCFIGEPGVGKTAIAEGIAQRIAEGRVPYRLQNKELYLLDLSALVAGTQFRGQFESRVKGLIDEVKRKGNVILFIDEVHTLVGTGDSEGSMSAANMLKPALSRGEVQIIGATTFAEYRKNIEKDAALERRFQPVIVKEPNMDDTETILSGIKEYYENFHKVKVPDSIIKKAVQLSERYITDRYLPDKAIDLLDEALSGVVLSNPSITEYEEKTAEAEKLKADLSELESNIENADYEKIASLRSELLAKENELSALKKKVDAITLTTDDLASVIELWTGIPASKIKTEEYAKIGALETELKKRIIGQTEAVEKVAKAIKLSRAELSRKKRPASFIFVGPTGVGKTELVRVLAEELFDDTEPLIRLDMSEYMEKHTVSKIIGSPPGYVGFDEAGQLTEKIRRRPYSVVLFDEIEKAHPDVMNILLQILDEGKITDSHGRQVSFENTVIVMTSNAGSTSKETGVGFNKSQNDISRERALQGLREFLRPEFLGRVDEIVVFGNLNENDFEGITKIAVDELSSVLSDKGITLNMTDEAIKLIARKSFKESGGARNIRKTLRREVENKIAEILTSPENIGVKEITVTAEDESIKIV